ncbi:MAG TPA: hypothetical protein VLW50_18490, partial [Streptosporangiaceae bacterium]|nr:hypothetical protein [Streptosporangiaceae bacterium]
EATELARRARDELAALGMVAADNLVEVADGNVAGVGDLIVARQNARIQAGEPGRRLANRDVLRIEAWDEVGEGRVALVRRVTGRDPSTRESWSAPFEVPEDYIDRHADLAYAGNVHVAQGRTVDTAHLVADETAGRASFYVGMSRGRERNTAYVVTERVHAADLSPEPRPAPEIGEPAARDDPAPRRHRIAVLADVLERQQTERSATGTMRQELERAASLATLAPMWADVTRAHATRRYEYTVQSLLAAGEWQRYEQDAERDTLTRLLRAADLAGHDVEDVLCHAIEGRDFGGADSIAAVLHGRIRRIVGTPEPRASASYADRTPVIADPDADRFARELATAMDDRVSLLANRVAVDRPVWALRTSARCRLTRSSAMTGSAEPEPWRPTGRNADMARRPKRSARRPNAHRPSSGRAGIRPASRCGCRRRTARSRPRVTVSCGAAGPRTSARPGGRRRTLSMSCGRHISRRTPTAPTPCARGTGRTPRSTRPSGRKPDVRRRK